MDTAKEWINKLWKSNCESWLKKCFFQKENVKENLGNVCDESKTSG